jgi:hypothetical protein
VREQELPRDRLCEIAVRLLDQQAIGEIHHVAAEGESVAVAALVFDGAGEAEEMRRLADLIQRHVRQRKIDFQSRRVTAPFAQPLTEDERIVAKAKRIREERGDSFRHQMCETPSGIL